MGSFICEKRHNICKVMIGGEYMKMKHSTLKYLLNLDILLAAVSLIVLITITFSGVIMRYFLNNPFVWLEEVQIWCFIWLVFLGAGAAFRSGSHVAIDVVVDLMPPIMKNIIEILGYLVVIYVLYFFIIHGSNLVKQLHNTGRLTNILRVPYPIIYGALPVGCILMMINHTLMTGMKLFKREANEEGREKEWI